MYLYFLALHVFFFIFELSMIGRDTVMCLFLFLVSHYATSIIDLYL